MGIRAVLAKDTYNKVKQMFIMCYGDVSSTCAAAGILGAHAVLFATSMCIIFVNIIEGEKVFSQWYTYLVSSCRS